MKRRYAIAAIVLLAVGIMAGLVLPWPAWAGITATFETPEDDHTDTMMMTWTTTGTMTMTWITTGFMTKIWTTMAIPTGWNR